MFFCVSIQIKNIEQKTTMVYNERTRASIYRYREKVKHEQWYIEMRARHVTNYKPKKVETCKQWYEANRDEILKRSRGNYRYNKCACIFRHILLD